MKTDQLIDIVIVRGNVPKKKHFWRTVSQIQALFNLATYAINQKVVMSFVFFHPF